MTKKKDVNENMPANGVEAAPAPPPSAPPPDAAPAVKLDGLLTDEERREILERLSPDQLELVAGMLEVLERQELFDRLEESSKRREAERQHKLKEAALIAEGESLDDVERMSLYIVGKLALDYHLMREQVRSDDGNQLYDLFRTINQSMREALGHADMDELECIKEAEREKERKASAALEDAEKDAAE